MREDNAFMEHLAPVYINVKGEMDNILLPLRLQPADPAIEAEPCIVNTGNSFLLTGLKEIAALKDLQPHQGLIAASSGQYGLTGIMFLQGKQ